MSVSLNILDWGNWIDLQGVVHAVNAYGFDTDLEFLHEGWETLCCAFNWHEEGPKPTKKRVTCLLCLGDR